MIFLIKQFFGARRGESQSSNNGYVSLSDEMQYGATSGLPKDRLVLSEQELKDVLADSSSSDENVTVDMAALFQE